MPSVGFINWKRLKFHCYFSSIFPISFQYIKYVIFLSLSIMCVKWHHKKYALQPSFRFFHILRVYMLCWLAKCTSGTHQMCSQILKGYRKVPILLKTPQLLQQSIKTSWFRKINGTFSIKRISDVFENKYFEFVKWTITKKYEFRNKKSEWIENEIMKLPDPIWRVSLT